MVDIVGNVGIVDVSVDYRRNDVGRIFQSTQIE